MKQETESSENGQIAIVSVGSNVTSKWGEPRETVLKCRSELSARFGTYIESSRIYQTPAFPKGSGPDFVNGAFCFQTSLIPSEILAVLHTIEAKAERSREVRWGARTLDLDLIGVGSIVLPDQQTWNYWYDLPLDAQQTKTPEQIILPHPRVQDRAFALVPLADIAPHWHHPVLNDDIVTLLNALPQSEIDAVRPLN